MLVYHRRRRPPFYPLGGNDALRAGLEDGSRADRRPAVGWPRQNELLLTSVGEGIYGVDLEGRITFVNPAAARLSG